MVEMDGYWSQTLYSYPRRLLNFYSLTYCQDYLSSSYLPWNPHSHDLQNDLSYNNGIKPCLPDCGEGSGS